MKTTFLDGVLSYIEESIDFGGVFSDVNASCLTSGEVAEILNSELSRIKLNKTAKPKDRESPKPLEVKTGSVLLHDLENPDLPEGFDIDRYIEELTALPNGGVFGSSNQKMEKSKSGGYSTIHTGVPAVSAIVYDIDKKQFYSLNTCPAAGQCIKYCYARKGQFAINSGTIMNLLRRINLLMNDPEEYEEMAYEELSAVARRENRAKRQLRIRWNDSGDFFSDEYFNIADRVTKRLIKRGRDVRSYAYTKVAKYVAKSREDFVINFSEEAKVSEVKKVDLDSVKISKVVPLHVFKDFKSGKLVDKTEELKEKLADHYGIKKSRLKYVDELPEKEGKKFQYDVIVVNKDTDIAAQREDVRVTYLLIH